MDLVRNRHRQFKEVFAVMTLFTSVLRGYPGISECTVAGELFGFGEIDLKDMSLDIANIRTAAFSIEANRGFNHLRHMTGLTIGDFPAVWFCK